MTSKDIEEKAILALKNYIWGSKVILKSATIIQYTIKGRFMSR